MKRVVSLFLAVVMMLTIFVIPGYSVSYADTISEDTESTQVVRKDISKAKVTFSYNSYTYRKGEPRKPSPTVKLDGKTLKKNIDYKITYSDNVYPGKAKVKITGINKYKGTVNSSFDIAKVLGVKVTSVGTNSVKLSWGAQKNVTGYKIYCYSSAKGQWRLLKTVKGSVTSSTVKELSAGCNYIFMVRSYVGKHLSTKSTSVYMPTKPGKVVLKSFTTSPKLEAVVSWKSKSCTGYQVMLSRSSSFKSTTKYAVRSKSTTSKRIKGLTAGITYYVKVRAYKTYKGKTSYGAWSNYKTIKSNSSGWITSNGDKYYYRDGKPLVGAHTINGNPYYFSKSDKGRLLGAEYEMWEEIKDKTSKTKYLVAVSRSLNRTCVYYKNNGSWSLKHYWKCTTGEEGIWTPRGSFLVPKIKTHLNSFGDSTYVVWYATRFKNACYFHSVLYRPRSKTKLVDGRLGQNLSHGCVRLKLENAKWIYDNIDAGTRVVVYH